MRFLIIGAGALGGYYGACCSRAAPMSPFWVRPGRAAQLAERGLVVKTRDREFRTPVTTVQAGVKGPYDVAIFTCKAYRDRRFSASAGR
jgi:2-dehydropantoate 2-reductase